MVLLKLEIVENKGLIKYIQKTILQRIAFPFCKYWIVPDNTIHVLDSRLYAHPEIINGIKKGKIKELKVK